MATWIHSTGNGEQIHNSPSLETAINELFWDIQPVSLFRPEIRTTPETVLWLIQNGTEEDWKIYANMQTETGNRTIDWLLDALYPYFNNPNYEWPEVGELSTNQQSLYNLVTSRLSQTENLIGVSALIPQVKSQVQGGIANRWNDNPWISVAVEVEKHGSRPKK